MSFQKVVKQLEKIEDMIMRFRTVSFQKVVKLAEIFPEMNGCFRTVSFQKVVKHSIENTH